MGQKEHKFGGKTAKEEVNETEGGFSLRRQVHDTFLE